MALADLPRLVRRKEDGPAGREYGVITESFIGLEEKPPRSERGEEGEMAPCTPY